MIRTQNSAVDRSILEAASQPLGSQKIVDTPSGVVLAAENM